MNANSEEYRDLTEVMKRHPDYKVLRRNIKKNPKKETYAGLTYQYMRAYIITHSFPEARERELAEFEDKIFISKCHAQGLRYPTIKKWFLEKFPEVAEFGVPELEFNFVITAENAPINGNMILENYNERNDYNGDCAESA